MVFFWWLNFFKNLRKIFHKYIFFSCSNSFWFRLYFFCCLHDFGSICFEQFSRSCVRTSLRPLASKGIQWVFFRWVVCGDDRMKTLGLVFTIRSLAPPSCGLITPVFHLWPGGERRAAAAAAALTSSGLHVSARCCFQAGISFPSSPLCRTAETQGDINLQLPVWWSSRCIWSPRPTEMLDEDWISGQKETFKEANRWLSNVTCYLIWYIEWVEKDERVWNSPHSAFPDFISDKMNELDELDSFCFSA